MSSEDVKAKLKERFLKFHQRIVEGCNKEVCFQSYCKNYPGNKPKTVQEAQQLALSLCKQSPPLCEEKIYPKSLQSSELNSLTSENPETQSKILYKRSAEVFGSLDSLSISFLPNDDYSHLVSSDFLKLDLATLNNLSELIVKLSPDENSKDSLLTVLCKASENCIDNFTIKYKEANKIDQAYLRVLLIFIELPLVLNHDWQVPLVSLMKAITVLSPQDREIILPSITKIAKKHFSNIVEHIQNLISIQLITSHDDTVLSYMFTFFEILYRANNISRYLPLQAFYIECITQEYEIGDEYTRWIIKRKKDPNMFSALSYPFAIEPGFKAKILSIESMVEMERELTQEMNGMGPLGGLSRILGGRLPGMQDMYLTLKVRRDRLMEDTLNQIAKPNLNFKKKMKVSFEGEHGIDEGGVKKEFFLLLLRQLMNPDFAMFVEKNKNTYLWFNDNPFVVPLNYELFGILLGLAIYNSVNLDLKFPKVLYKKLLDEKLYLDDIIEIEPEIHLGLVHILEYKGDLEKDLFQTFEVVYEVFGEERTHELKENGSKIFVTQENKHEYVDLFVDWILNKSINNVFKYFYKGFKKVVTGDGIKLFAGEELQVLICGSEHLEFEELEKVTLYEEPYTSKTQIIKDFWEIIHSLTLEEKKQFLMFVSGSDRAPIRGLGDMKFIISRHGPDSETLPSAHTCFNHLLIPEYSSKEKLREKLLLAIGNSQGFGLY